MIRRWAALSAQRRRLVVEAVAQLLVARWALRPAGDWQRALGERRDVASPPPNSGADADVVADIGWAVHAAAGRVPWRAVCLPQAIAVQRMLRRRGLHGRAVVGARRAGDEGGVDLHAWVLVDAATVVGGRRSRSFRPVVAYDV